MTQIDKKLQSLERPLLNLLSFGKRQNRRIWLTEKQLFICRIEIFHILQSYLTNLHVLLGNHIHNLLLHMLKVPNFTLMYVCKSTKYKHSIQKKKRKYCWERDWDCPRACAVEALSWKSFTAEKLLNSMPFSTTAF